MDPNNNLQQSGTQPVQPVAPATQQPVQQPAQQPMSQPMAASQPLQQPVSAPPPAPAATAMPPAPPIQETPKSGSKKGLILILILLILVLGMAYYVFFAKQRINSIQKAATENTTIAIPTVTAPPAAPSSVDEISVENPEADLKDIESDLQGL